MKKVYILSLLLLFAVKVFSQTGRVFHLNKLSAKDTLLSGWLFNAGDNPHWAEPGYNDDKWQPADASTDILQFTALRQQGIGWLRLHISVDTAVAKQQLAAYIVQHAASEVYLNGRLIKQYGTVSSNPKKVVAYLPSTQPFLINLLNDTINVIAVRLAYQPGIPYVSYLNTYLPVFNLYINQQATAAENYLYNDHQIKMYVIIYSINSGTLLIIGFIYLVHFLFDKSRKVHLYYGLCMLALSINALPIEVWGAGRYGNLTIYMWVFYIECIGLTLGTLFIVLTIYTLFNYPHRTVFKILVLCAIALVVYVYINGTWAYFWGTTLIFPAICLLEGAYACLWAIKRHKKDAAIILTGVLFYFVISLLSAFIPVNSISSQLLFYVAQMCFPIGMSFYLGIQSSLTNKQLKATLVEVQALSAQNLAQEQEKQHILANQNELLEQQVTERTAELNQSLQELKSTQAQLIQSEKMASLGELTAGIAHEIQNPLNFVNNFSEVSCELVAELQEERHKAEGVRDKDLEDEILTDIKQNLEKINHHGKRADAIVKGMLQHSRKSEGKKELTDINALCDEYLRLSYHGLRAKDKSFNATLETNFDESIGEVNVVAQDMGRVILNILTNAFYAVAEKKKAADLKASDLEGFKNLQGLGEYQPTVTLATKKSGNNVIITVTDNGNGIPQNIIDKIFQPFFTTKPTGQGTGLGLSLTYDIVKVHGGEIKVETKEGEGTAFIITLPGR